jgi:phospholipid-transporting ATPase
MVTMEVVKLQQASLINGDLDLYYERHDCPATARTSNLVEELGQIEYIFSDKTGTLTCNEMEFKECCVAGVAYAETVVDAKRSRMDENGKEYGQFDFEQLRTHSREDQSNDPARRQRAQVLNEFFTLLAVCHTVIPERVGQSEGKADEIPSRTSIVYQASSPDEGALVKGAQTMDYFFHTRRPKSVIISARGQELEYEILNICEFNSTRKRMSAIVRCPDGKIKLYTKGADTVILERLKRDPSFPETDARSLKTLNPFVEPTLTHLEDYATEGLRTLCIAMREISEQEYKEWSAVYERAATTINNRTDEVLINFGA